MFIKANSNYLQTVRIEVGTLLGLKTDDEAYITLKEIPTIDMMRLKESYENGDRALMEFFKEILPFIIIDHNFYETENKKMSNDEVTNIIFGSLDLTRKVMDSYTQASFFTRTRERGEK